MSERNIEIITVSSKGQISIPVQLRKSLNISEGDKLVAYSYGDSILLKTVKLPSVEEFQTSLKEAQDWAKEVGYREDDVNDIVKSVRMRKKQ